jgi:TetR/AcrR family transcriptional repressor of nem operon
LKYKPEEAVQKATELFWEQGFQGTKMRDLQAKLNMRPGSIYAGFGSKENLFRQALNFYVVQSLNNIDSFRKDTRSPLVALRAFVESQIFARGDIRNCRMCLLVKTLSETENNNQALTSLARSGLQRIENKFSTFFSEAQTMGLIDQAADCDRLGKWLQMQIMGLVIYSKGLANPDDVSQMIEDIFTSIKLTH